MYSSKSMQKKSIHRRKKMRASGTLWSSSSRQSNKHLAVVEALADGLHELIDGQLLLPVSGQAIHELVEQLRADRLPDSADLVGLKLK